MGGRPSTRSTGSLVAWCGARTVLGAAWPVLSYKPIAPGNADLIRPIYEEWSRGNWRSRFEVYHPHMEWGWSDEFPGLDGVFEDRRDPNPRLYSWLSEWEDWRVEVDDCRSTSTVHTSLRCATTRWSGSKSSPTATRRSNRFAQRSPTSVPVSADGPSRDGPSRAFVPSQRAFVADLSGVRDSHVGFPGRLRIPCARRGGARAGFSRPRS
jgi:hypothetical protein